MSTILMLFLDVSYRYKKLFTPTCLVYVLMVFQALSEIASCPFISSGGAGCCVHHKRPLQRLGFTVIGLKSLTRRLMDLTKTHRQIWNSGV